MDFKVKKKLLSHQYDLCQKVNHILMIILYIK